MFQETYRKMNDPIGPDPALAAETVARAERRARPRLRRRAAAAAALALALCVGTAVAAGVEPVYQLLYAVSPAAAQLFQPVRRSCTDGGVTMEVAAVAVEGSRAQAVLALSGGAVDETTDLFDSYSFRLPFDQTSHCERLDFDPETGTAYFQITTETLDGSPIPGGKMTVSLGCFLSGRETAEDLAVDLPLGACARAAETAPVWAPGRPEDPGAYVCTGGGPGAEELPMLLPGAALAEPAEGLSITAAGYAEGAFHVQVCRRDATKLDNHCRLWLEDGAGNRLEPRCAYFTNSGGEARLDYLDAVFDVSPEALPGYTLRGDFTTSAALTEGTWRVTFPLEDT